MMEWISVKDRRPDSDQIVVCLGMPSVWPFLCKFVKERGSEMPHLWMSLSENEGDGSITHWMPLPAPPQVES